ncbi:MAG: proteasome accessory factor PafA2 family protein, partial [Microthrixaceae bacterium]|nr:proteasome accessory factor PafA2 family protein [Microthrixaceae bacterium]
GSTATALELQWDLLRSAHKWSDRFGFESVGESVGSAVLQRWEAVLAGLEVDKFSLASQLDWVAKLRLFQAYRERHGLEWSDHKLAAMDLQYHDLRPGSSLARRVGLETLVDSADVAAAITEPPSDTRAYFRGTCLSRYPDSVVAANWDSMVFDTGERSLQRVPMMDPGRGTREALADLIEASPTAAELVESLRT